MLGRLPVHPLLIAAAPVLLLWWQNATEVRTDEALGALWPVLLGAALLTALAAALLRSLRRGALIGSIGAFLFLAYGHLWGLDRSAVMGLLIWTILMIAGAVWAARTDDDELARITAVTNVIGVVLVALTLPGVASAGGSNTVDAAESLDLAADGQPLRDIVYIIPDRYGRADSLDATFGIDNTTFTGFLEDRGFAVLDEARGNYTRTSHSLSSTLAMEYLDELAATIGPDDRDDLGPVYARLRDHRVGRVLTEAGYEYIHIGSWWSPTATADDADQVLNYDTRSEFAQVLGDTTLAPALRAVFGDGEAEPETGRDRIRNHSAWQLDQLERLVADTTDHPRFILAHITLPHEPYVFDRDGSPVSEETEKSRPRSENYERQLAYLNGRLMDVIDAAVDHPDDTAPIVLLQADEGPHTEAQELRVGSAFRWDTASDAELATKLKILSAYRLPGFDADEVVPEDLTPVNSFRLILDLYLDAGLGLLDDRTYTYPGKDDLYTFTDVTDRIDVPEPEPGA